MSASRSRLYYHRKQKFSYSEIHVRLVQPVSRRAFNSCCSTMKDVTPGPTGSTCVHLGDCCGQILHGSPHPHLLHPKSHHLGDISQIIVKATLRLIFLLLSPDFQHFPLLSSNIFLMVNLSLDFMSPNYPPHLLNICFFVCFCVCVCLRFYLFTRERDKVKYKQGKGQREKQTPCQAGSPTRGSVPGPSDHDLNQRQMLNCLSHQVPARMDEF